VIRAGRYRLEEPLGQGAMGIVYRASDDEGGEFAVKLLRPQRAHDAVARARFVRETRLADAIQSAHLVPTLEIEAEGDTTYLVMPLFSGGSLAARVRDRGRLGVAESTALAAQLGRGLDALHEHGILHRDIKPSNVLLDAHGDAALADFGLALGVDSTRITVDGQLLGTAHYLAPELIAGADATRASDIYALGCLLYECLVGAPPFTGRDVAEIGFAHLVEDPPDPRERRPELSADLVEALLTSLEKEPSARPTSATALARMLHRARTAARA
jgi:serine/threonine protein kinase